jgi:hypothetical protein
MPPAKLRLTAFHVPFLTAPPVSSLNAYTRIGGKVLVSICRRADSFIMLSAVPQLVSGPAEGVTKQLIWEVVHLVEQLLLPKIL